MFTARRVMTNSLSAVSAWWKAREKALEDRPCGAFGASGGLRGHNSARKDMLFLRVSEIISGCFGTLKPSWEAVLEQFVPESCFGTICPGKLFWNNLPQEAFLEQFVPERSFGTICPGKMFWNNLSRKAVLEQFVPSSCSGAICLGKLFWNNLSRSGLLEQLVPENCFGTICPGKLFWNNSSL